MDVLLTDDERTVQEAAAGFLATESTASRVRDAERDPDRISRALWAKIAEQGWIGISLPEAVGGQGLPLSYLGLLFEELGRRLAPVPMLGTAVAALILARYGGDAHRDLVRAVVAGDAILAVAVQGRDGSWSPDVTATTGVVEGGVLVLDGEVGFVDGFRAADRCLVAYREAGGAPGLALVDPRAPGLTIADLITTAGDAQATVRFEGVRVPLADRIGTGRALLLETMDLLAVFTAALMVGAAGEATHRAVEYAKGRVAFGQPIGSFQAIQHMAADMTIGVDGAQLLVREALYRLSNGLPARVEVAQAKAFASEKCLAAARMAQQIHGGIGFIAEFDQQLWYRRVAAWSLRCGTAPEHRLLVAESLLDRQGPVRLGYEQSLEIEPA